MTHHRMGFTPSSSTTSSSSSSTTTKPSAITTKKPSQRACLGGMVITPCEKCTIRTTSKCRNCNGNMFVRNTLRNCPGCGLCGGGGGAGIVGGNGNGDGNGDGDDGDDQSKSRGRKDSGVGL